MCRKRNPRNTLTVDQRAISAAEVADPPQTVHVTDLDMLAAGQYISRRIMGNLSIETSDAEAEAFCQAVEEFLVSRGDVVRAVFPQS